jgi:hypothetical protein
MSPEAEAVKAREAVPFDACEVERATEQFVKATLHLFQERLG